MLAKQILLYDSNSFMGTEVESMQNETFHIKVVKRSST